MSTSLVTNSLLLSATTSPASASMKMTGLSYNTQKALMVHVGDTAGAEIANLLAQLCAEIEELRRTKVNVTKIVPGRGVDRPETIEEPI